MQPPDGRAGENQNNDDILARALVISGSVHSSFFLSSPPPSSTDQGLLPARSLSFLRPSGTLTFLFFHSVSFVQIILCRLGDALTLKGSSIFPEMPSVPVARFVSDKYRLFVSPSALAYFARGPDGPCSQMLGRADCVF